MTDLPAVFHVLMTWLSEQHLLPIGDRQLRLVDVACGSGEASECIERWLNAHRRGTRVDVWACDPYTQEAYEHHQRRACHGYSFAELAAQPPHIQWPHRSDLAVCSFALHLASDSLVFGVLTALAPHCRLFAIVSPHKLPHIRDPERYGWRLIAKFIERRVHVRVFESLVFDDDAAVER